MLIQVDLPALERPTKAISGTVKGGKNSSCGAVVKNLAVCIQPMAIFLDAAISAAFCCAVLTGVDSVVGITSIRTE